MHEFKSRLKQLKTEIINYNIYLKKSNPEGSTEIQRYRILKIEFGRLEQVTKYNLCPIGVA